MFAIFQDSGGQFKVKQGDVILVDKKGLDEGHSIQFDKVLFVEGKVGTPFVEGALVHGKVKGAVQGKKLYVHKFKRRKKYRRKTGHRQAYTEVEITGIDA